MYTWIDKPKKKTSSRSSASTFLDEEDDSDLFGTTKSEEKRSKPVATKDVSGLFEDGESDNDDLFASFSSNQSSQKSGTTAFHILVHLDLSLLAD